MNTGWSGGSYGVGKRIKLSHTRAVIDAIHNGKLAKAKTQSDPVFGLDVVAECFGVPNDILVPRTAWTDKAAYDSTARKLFNLFQDNFKKYQAEVTGTVVAA